LFALCYRWFASEFVAVMNKWFVRLSSFVPDFQVALLHSSSFSFVFDEIWSGWLSLWTWQDCLNIWQSLPGHSKHCSSQPPSAVILHCSTSAVSEPLAGSHLSCMLQGPHNDHDALEYCLAKWIQRKTDYLPRACWLRRLVIAAAVAATRMSMYWFLAHVMDVMDSRACNGRCNWSCNGSRQHVID
jgi:hypothetical protein